MTTIKLVTPWHVNRALDEVRNAPLGYVVSIKEPSRNLDQNAKLWAQLSDISRAQPLGRQHRPEVWKLLLMSACGHECQFEMGIDGRPFPVGFSTSRLTVREMSELIEYVQAWGAQHGVTFTDKMH